MKEVEILAEDMEALISDDTSDEELETRGQAQGTGRVHCWLELKILKCKNTILPRHRN